MFESDLDYRFMCSGDLCVRVMQVQYFVNAKKASPRLRDSFVGVNQR